MLALLATAGPASPRAQLEDLRTLPKAELAARLQAISAEDLIALGRESLRTLGTYRARLVKQERVGGKVLPAQTIEVTVRPSPRALRLEYVEGPKSGRRVVWTPSRPSEMLVREAGILGVASMWIDLNGSLARGDTNHSATEIGFGPIFDLLSNDLRKGRDQGGLIRKDEGYDGSGNYCMVYTAPAGAKGLYAERTRLCIDVKLALPVKIEVNDRQGFLERYEYTNVRPNQHVEPATFEKV
jgi:hypothetical protein